MIEKPFKSYTKKFQEISSLTQSVSRSHFRSQSQTHIKSGAQAAEVTMEYKDYLPLMQSWFQAESLLILSFLLLMWLSARRLYWVTSMRFCFVGSSLYDVHSVAGSCRPTLSYQQNLEINHKWPSADRPCHSAISAEAQEFWFLFRFFSTRGPWHLYPYVRTSFMEAPDTSFHYKWCHSRWVNKISMHTRVIENGNLVDVISENPL